jgi:hypothetical protein
MAIVIIVIAVRDAVIALKMMTLKRMRMTGFVLDCKP